MPDRRGPIYALSRFVPHKEFPWFPWSSTMLVEITGNRDVDTARVLRHITRALATHISDLADHKYLSRTLCYRNFVG